VATRATEPVVEIEMAKRGIEVVAVHQDHHPAPKPNAFGVAGRAVDGLRRLDKFIGFARIVLGHVRRRDRIGCRRLAGLIGGLEVAAMGESASDPEREDKPGNGEVTQNRIFQQKPTSTHKFPDLFPARGRVETHLGRAGLMPSK